MHHKNILIYIQQDATLHSLFYLESALHVSGGTITHHQQCKQLYLQHLVFFTPLLLPAAKPIISSANNCIYSIWYFSRHYCYLPLKRQVAVTAWKIPDAVDTVVCAADDGWWYHPKHVERIPDKINCVTLHLVGYILEECLVTWKCNLDININIRADAKHVWKENIAKHIWPNTWEGMLASQME